MADIQGTPDGRTGLRRRITGKFAYVLLIVGAACLVGGIWGAVELRVTGERKIAEARATDRADSSARIFEQYVLRTLIAADHITQMAVVSLSTSNASDLIRFVKQAHIIDDDFFYSLNVEDENGELIGTTVENAPLFNYADRLYFKEAAKSKSGGLIVGAPVVSRLSGQPMIPIVRRLTKADGTFGGLVLLQVKTNAFANGYKDLGLRGMDYMALIGLDGVARVGNIGDTQISGKDFSNSNVFVRQRLKPSDTFIAKGKIDQVLRYVTYRTLAGYPLFIACGVEAEAALGEFEKDRTEAMTLGLLTTILVLGFAGILGFLLIQKDRTFMALQIKEAALRNVAEHDFLTGAPNRAALEFSTRKKLIEASAQGFEVACLFIDLDGFGEINAALSHTAGDEVLKAVAGAIALEIKPIGQFARLGGDEFVAIFRTEGEAEACALGVAHQIRQSVEGLHVVGDLRFNLRASIGISVFPKHAQSYPDLIRCADDAMNCSKVGRRGVPHVFSPAMENGHAKRLALRSDLTEAIKNHQLEVFYQPKLDLATKRPFGMEALVRWRHPVRGLISPAEFIPIAEDSGLIIPVGDLVLNQACRDCEQLNREGFWQLSVAVNVSAFQFRQPDLVDGVRRALMATGLPASRLELELTESMIADDPDVIAVRLEHLKALGVSLALDDFGTGYSNLQYLRRFPLDVLKIDRSFVVDIPDSGHANAIGRAIIGLARSLELKVVAEGIETSTQNEFLLANGCDAGQGYLYGKPMPLEEFRKWLNARVSPERVLVALPGGA